MTDAISKEELVEHVTDIVAAYVSNNPVQASNLPELIETVHSALAKLADGEAAKEAEKPVPAVPVRRSVQQDYIICLEDGKKFKSMKRHLGVHYNMTPVEYRLKWGLPDDYPMVAPSYAAARSELAKSMGLGRRPKGAAKGRGKR
ncbi:MAG: MucR family transcriptional regulator [Rhizobiaceae bacterium]|nr:MucR family transcriptional regulator [Rhizobiaceae bacterium]